MKGKWEPKQWEDVPLDNQGHGVTLFAPDSDVEKNTLTDEHGRRADCVIGAMAVSASATDERGEENVAEGYRIGFLVMMNREALEMDLEAKAAPSVIAEVIANFHVAMRSAFGDKAINQAAEILREENLRQREIAVEKFMQMIHDADRQN